jgi:glucose/arabinose dehydrogenase
MRTSRTAALAAAAVTAVTLLAAPPSGAAPAPESQRATTAVIAPTAVAPIGSTRISPRLVVGGFRQPVLVTTAADGLNRLFVVERAGRVRLVESNAITGTYLDIRSVVNDAGGEQGLLGLAFAPDFRTSRYLWATYTRSDGALVVARFRASSATARSVSAGTRSTVLVVPHPTYSNHNGGNIAFGPDGYLYLGTGDGGGGGDPGNNAQRLSQLLGKMLRIDVRCSTAKYCIPATNPYAASSTRKREIWMSGLRNPWRWSFDGSRLAIADVGQGKYEEVTFVPASAQKGANLGWSCYEGRTVYKSSRCRSGVTYTMPQIVYCHPGVCTGARQGESITGGFVYRGSVYPFAAGAYVFADFITGKVWGYRSGGYTPGASLPGVTGFGRSDGGELYAVTYDGGLYRIRFAQV